MRSLSRIPGLAALLLAASLAYGAAISGTVKGPDGAVEGAFVQARNANTRVTFSVLSDKQGRYRVDNLPAGDYQLRVKAEGYRSDPERRITLAAEQSVSADLSLQKGQVRWSDLTIYQGMKLLPQAPGKETYVARCLGCHGFEARVASTRRDEDGWRDRVNYMRDTMLVRLSDQNVKDIVSYLNTEFGEGSSLPRSPADLPQYKDLEQHFSDEAMKIVYVEYDMPGPGRMPWDANPDKNGNVWIPYYSQVNGVARLDPKTGEVREFKLPNEPRAAIHSAYPGPDGNVWFTEQMNNRLGKLDPRTQKMTEYPDVPIPAGMLGSLGAVPSKHTVRVDPRGIVWASGHPFTRFDPKTEKFTEYSGPGEPTNTYGIALDKTGDHVWFDGFTPDGKIYEVDTRSGKLLGGWQPPTAGLPRRIQVDEKGIVWFCEYKAGKIGRFDPNTQTFKEFQLPGALPSPYALSIDKNGDVWYSSEFMDVIGRLDPQTGKVLVYPFPQVENTMREFYYDAQGRTWFGSPANNKVGYFYLAEK